MLQKEGLPYSIVRKHSIYISSQVRYKFINLSPYPSPGCIYHNGHQTLRLASVSLHPASTDDPFRAGYGQNHELKNDGQASAADLGTYEQALSVESSYFQPSVFGLAFELMFKK